MSSSTAVVLQLILHPTAMNFALYACERALNPSNEKYTAPTGSMELNAAVMAASQWILLLALRIYDEVLIPRKEKGPTHPTTKQWRRWWDELEQAACWEPGSKRYTGLSDEARVMAGKAVEEMRAAQVKMGRPSDDGSLLESDFPEIAEDILVLTTDTVADSSMFAYTPYRLCPPLPDGDAFEQSCPACSTLTGYPLRLSWERL